jgi:flavin reductase (DIM6/NTAB) family NADH-FMN oxidoreductase RutF
VRAADGGIVYLDLREMDTRDAYRLLIGTVVPRPIAWVSTVSADGIGNLAPFSFFNAVSSSPPMVVISVGSRGGVPKDTARNVREVPEFVLNVVNEDVGEAMNATSAELSFEHDELALADLTPLPSTRVRPVRVAESPIHIECKVDQLISIGTGENTLILGEVLAYHIRDDVFDPERKRIRLDRLNALGRLAGDGYCRTRDQFEMIRPDPNYRGR